MRLVMFMGLVNIVLGLVCNDFIIAKDFNVMFLMSISRVLMTLKAIHWRIHWRISSQQIRVFLIDRQAIERGKEGEDEKETKREKLGVEK